LPPQLAQIQQAIAANRQSLGRYTWLERQTVLVKAEVRKEEVYQVRLGADGNPQRTLLSSGLPPSHPIGPIRRRVVEKITAEYEQYGQQIGALAQDYAQPDPQRLQRADQLGNISLELVGLPGEVRVTIVNYIKPQDYVALVFNRTLRAVLSLDISSYLSDPSDAVRISAQFGKLPDGTTHVVGMIVNGVRKQLVVQLVNSDYQKR
jgi:hypothetical protein